jgi:uncharacterized membrane protein YbaN (DUF454 family)
MRTLNFIVGCVCLILGVGFAVLGVLASPGYLILTPAFISSSAACFKDARPL